MSKRNIILKQFKIDIENKVTVLNGYSMQPHNVFRGIYTPNNTHILPSLWYYTSNDLVHTHYLDINHQFRILEVQINGYCDTEYNDFDNVHLFVDTMEQFLISKDWTYCLNTKIENIQIIEIGEVQGISEFQIDIEISYNKKDC